jgi:two-component sensor histidine kinase
VRASGSLEGFAEAFEGRLGALARAHGLLTSTGWAGADLRGLAEQTLEPYLDGAAEVAVGGPSLALPPRRAVAVAMVLHELATNAAKHGALSVPGGRVGVAWEVEDGARRVRLAWREAGGPAVEAAPGRKGFGTTLIEQSLRFDLEGTGGLRFEPDGLRCELSFPLG